MLDTKNGDPKAAADSSIRGQGRVTAVFPESSLTDQ